MKIIIDVAEEITFLRTHCGFGLKRLYLFEH